jgi:asparagine synthase (glutamine-hydrolysing)
LFLSSGLDSGAIAALAAKEHPGIESFTLAFPGTEYDESELTRRVAAQCGTKHKEVALEGGAVAERMDEVLGALDQPSMDGVNTYFVSWAAREVGLKVALSGLGGDELFAGYPTFSSVPKAERVATAARFFPGGVRRATRGLLRAALQSSMTSDAAAKAAAAWSNAERLPHAYFFARALFAPEDLAQLIEPRFRPSSVAADGTSLEPTWLGWLQRAADDARRMEPIGGVSWMEMRCYMASTLLRDTDSVSMAQSLEVRVPLLDTPLVEFMCALPDEARWLKERQKAAESTASGCAERFVASGNCRAKEADVYATVGAVVARRVACAGREEFYGNCGAIERIFEARRSAESLAGFLGGENDVVAAMGNFCIE